ncbi:MAG TPA: adenylate/guanylate cyclase domain-containing protein [Nitrososphaerales archaeon]|nr:adenylate/guanylate cyclase domain-containing protein [Nitrososphaerales archaeon]
MSEGQRRLAAIMFTDMVGFTALTQSDEAQSLAVLERHNRLLRPIFPKYRGREVKTIGDSFLVEFDSALDATNCAVEIQRFLHDYNLSSKDEWKITLRIGVHLGDVVHSGGDILGDAVNIASRLQPLAQPEGICISEQIYDQVRNKLSLGLLKLEPQEIKGIKFALDVYRVVMPWERMEVVPVQELDSKRIAVLPFVSLSPDPNDEFFADGLTEELIDRLCQVKELAVIARTSVMNYKKKEKNASQIGKELKAGALVEGSIRKAGNKVRVTAQLINAGTEEHMWSSRYDRDLEDIFAVQTDIAENVAGALKIRLLQGEIEQISRVPTKDPEAHEFYLKGMSHMLRGTEENIRAALSFFERAISRDPDYIEPYRSLAAAHFFLATHEIVPTNDAFPKIREYLNKALELDSTSAESHLDRGILLELEMNYHGQRREIERALQLNPNLSSAHGSLALSYIIVRDFGKAHLEIQKSLDLDPLSVERIIHSATFYLYGRDPDRALELYQKALSIDPGNPFVFGNIGLCHISKGMYEQGLTEVKRSLEMGIRHPNAMADLPYALTKAGKVEEASKVVQEMVRYHEEHGTGTNSVGRGFAAIGEKDKALEWLERAFEERSPLLRWSAVDFNLEGMQSDPRFQALLKRLGLEKPSVI